MITVSRERQRAARFAARVGGDPLPEPATGLDARLDAELDRLVQVAGELREAAEVDASASPRPAFAVGLRERLMTEARTVLTPPASALTPPARPHGRRERRLVAAATAAVLLGGSAGMAAASQSALPGQALYPVKRLLERVDVGVSGSSTARGQDLLSQAGSRLDEVQGLMAAGPAQASAQVPATLQEFTRQADQGAEQLLAAYADTHDPKTIATVRRKVAADADVLTVVARSAPAAAQPALLDAVAALGDIDRQALSACADCSDLPVLQIPEPLPGSEPGDALGPVTSGGTVPRTGGTTPPRTAHGRRAGSTLRGRRHGAVAGAGAHRAASGHTTGRPSAVAVPTVSSAPDPAGGVLGTSGGEDGGSAPTSSGPGSDGATTSGAPGSGHGTEHGGGSGSQPGGGSSSSTSSSGSSPSDPLGDVVDSLLPDAASGGLLGD